MFYILIIAFFTALGAPTLSYSEIEKVVIKWKPGFCSEACLVDLERRLNTISDIAEIKFQGAQNQVTIRWKPNKRFNYNTIDRTMRYVGVNIHEIFVTIRGTITHTSKEVMIQSIGDDTTFTILSPITIKPGDAAVEKNIQSHKLKLDTRNQLAEAEEANKIVKIEGPLFEPERSPPLYMIAERVTIPPSWKKSRGR
ncbi:MAG: hypothetical protein VX777_10545 [Chlamydiota bacterium]|nr:hypothetical protein [Chlamydiota bacterium]